MKSKKWKRRRGKATQRACDAWQREQKALRELRRLNPIDTLALSFVRINQLVPVDVVIVSHLNALEIAYLRVEPWLASPSGVIQSPEQREAEMYERRRFERTPDGWRRTK
jgi:hypothetical protein